MKKSKTTTDLMVCVPHRKLDWYMDEETGRVVIKKPKFQSKVGKQFLAPFMKSENFLVKLDDLGTVAWQNCNGSNTVKKIGVILGQKFGKEIEPIYDRLFKFMIQLQRDKFIELQCPETGE